LPGQQVTKRYGIAVTTAARTVADIARTTTFLEGVVVADAALYDRQASGSELRRVLDGCERWPGTGRARQVIDFADGLAESVLESCARVLFREYGLPSPELQVHITGRDRTMIARVDFFWRRYGVIAETDGLLKYDSGERAIAERRRDRLLQEAGFEVVHVTWQELFGDPGRVAGPRPRGVHAGGAPGRQQAMTDFGRTPGSELVYSPGSATVHYAHRRDPARVRTWLSW
jgi:hypothetical protein